jgi:hypothetical protein
MCVCARIYGNHNNNTGIYIIPAALEGTWPLKTRYVPYMSHVPYCVIYPLHSICIMYHTRLWKTLGPGRPGLSVVCLMSLICHMSLVCLIHYTGGFGEHLALEDDNEILGRNAGKSLA